jgi:hypothetical protein
VDQRGIVVRRLDLGNMEKRAAETHVAGLISFGFSAYSAAWQGRVSLAGFLIAIPR